MFGTFVFDILEQTAHSCHFLLILVASGSNSEQRCMLLNTRV